MILQGQCNISIIGKTGVGKSTLINVVFGKTLAEARAGKPVTQTIEQYAHQDCPVKIYDSPGLELSNSAPIIELFFNRNKQTQKNISHLIFTARFC